ncbi:MAG TPA: ABC transporter permease [Acidimicrobiales bacterium]|nr:ABC transporter permease [Acidimicrobiales bacterium]
MTILAPDTPTAEAAVLDIDARADRRRRWLKVVRRYGLMVGALAGVFALSEILASFGSTKVQGLLPLPLSVMLLSVIFACLTALMAIGLVMVYRASRIINFAQAGFGGVASVLFFELQSYLHVSYWLALPAALLAGSFCGVLVEILFIRRFNKAPRLVLTVVTLGAGQALAALATGLPFLMRDSKPSPTAPPSPLSHHKWNLYPVIITGDHLLLLGLTLVLMAGLAVFLRSSAVGVAIRGAAENEDRASTLGIRTSNLSMIVWGIAGGLSAVGAVLMVSIQGLAGLGSSGASLGSIGSGVLLQALAAAVIGGMEDLPVTVAAAFGLTVLQEAVYFAFAQTGIVDAGLLGVIVVVLLFRRRRLGRQDESVTGTWSATEEVRPVPKELASLPSVRSGIRRVLGVGAIVLLAYPWVMSPSQTNTGSLFAIYGIVVVSLVVLTGWGGQISLGQFAIVGIGALVGGYLIGRVGWPFLPSLVVASLAGMVVAVLIGLPALRIRGLYLAVTTLALAIATDSVLLNPRYMGGILASSINRPKFIWIDLADQRDFYYFCLLCLAFAVFVAMGIRRSRAGRVLIAMRDNERGAQAFGINLVRTRLITFAISGFLAAFAGVLYAVQEHTVTQAQFIPDMSIQMFLMAVIGGLGSVAGSLTGAVYLGILTVVLKNSLWGQLAASAVGVLLVLMFFPGGVGSIVFKARDAVLRRVAIRRHIYVPSLLGGFGLSGDQMARAPLAPKFGADGAPAEVATKWRLPSRIESAGASQGAGWRFQ